MSKQNLVTGLLAGAAVGAVLGLLFAPDKGSATRRKLRNKGGECKDQLCDQFGNLIDDASHSVEKVKSKISSFMGQAEDKVQDLAQKAESKANEFADKAADTARDLTNKAENAVDRAKSNL